MPAWSQSAMSLSLVLRNFVHFCGHWSAITGAGPRDRVPLEMRKACDAQYAQRTARPRFAGRSVIDEAASCFAACARGTRSADLDQRHAPGLRPRAVAAVCAEPRLGLAGDSASGPYHRTALRAVER